VGELDRNLKTLWIYGEVEFKDGLHLSHEMRWCYKTFKRSPENEEFEFITCNGHNDGKLTVRYLAISQ